MRFEFADPGEVLRVVSPIPDARIQRLIGRNGIGKTLSLRILQICSNENPWQDDPASLRSFCEHLPPDYRVYVTDSNDRRFTFVLDPIAQHWADEHGRIEPRPFVVADGNETPVNEMTPLETVVLSGRESLLDVLHARVEAERVWFDGLAEEVHQRLRAVESAFVSVGEWVADADSTRLDELSRQIEAQETEVERRLAEHDRLKAQGESANERRQRLERAQDELPALLSQLEGLRASLAEADKDLSALRKEVDKATSRSGTAERQRAEKARSLTDARQQRYEAARRQLQEALRDPLLTGIARTDLRSRLREERKRKRKLERERERLSSQEPLSALSRELDHRLGQYANPDDVVAKVHERDVSVAELHSGVKAHQKGLPSIRQADILNEQIAENSELIGALEKANDAEENAERKRKLKEESDEAANAETQPLASMLQQEREVMEQRNDIEQSILDLERRRDELLGGAEDLDALRAAVASGDSTTDRHAERTALAQAAEAEYQARRQLDETMDAYRTALKRADAARERLGDVGLGGALESGHDQLRQQLDVASAKLTELSVHVQGCSDAYRTVASRLRAIARPGHDDTTSGTRTIEGRGRLQRLNNRLSKHVNETLAERNISGSLIEDAALGDIDLLEATYKVRYHGSDREVTRPLKTLSSGQMVYAYARAVIAGLDPPPADRHRLIALDEFGAYLDDERKKHLLAALGAHLDDTPRTQILLVLPGDADDPRGYDFIPTLE